MDRAHQQAREARKNAKPRSTRGAQSNENTMRQADIMDWVLDRLGELEVAASPAVGAAAQEKGSQGGKAAPRAGAEPTADQVREAISQPHVSTFGDLWAEFPESAVASLRKTLWALAEAGEVDLATGGGIELTAEEEVAFVEEVQEIGGVSVGKRARKGGHSEQHQEHFGRTKVVRIRSHNRARGSRNQAKRDNRGRR
ncbi:MAG: hypothetical protein EA350_15990 [Gemmatimonadales bacterium]|nr:MAG: hypothetical protein EA350_15990 [Gemmatimonadales bacterium]